VIGFDPGIMHTLAESISILCWDLHWTRVCWIWANVWTGAGKTALQYLGMVAIRLTWQQFHEWLYFQNGENVLSV